MTIKSLAEAAGISRRTLRYYDSIGLLTASKRTASGYRLYDETDVLRLQQILILKRLGFDLDTIGSMVHDQKYDIEEALNQQKQALKQQQHQLNQLLDTIDRTLARLKGGVPIHMDDAFEGLKKQTLEENEDKYGTEIREKYGEDVVNQTYQQMRKLSTWEWNKANDLGQEILTLLPQAMRDGIRSETAIMVCEKHQEWIQFYWPSYDKDAHLALCKMYTEDERFTAYYDAVGDGAATFLYQAMNEYLAQ